MSNPNAWDDPRAAGSLPSVEVSGSYEPNRAVGYHDDVERPFPAETNLSRQPSTWAGHERAEAGAPVEPDIWVDHGSTPAAPGGGAHHDAGWPGGTPAAQAGGRSDPWTDADPANPYWAESADPSHGYAGHGYADQGYADQGYADQGYADQGYGAPAPLGPDGVPVDWADDAGQPGRRQQRRAQLRGEAQAREERWQRNRLAVPYSIDGPKVSLGVLWFGAVVVAVFVAPLAVGLIAASVAALAGLQVAHAWYPGPVRTKWWAAAAAFVTGIGGVLGWAGVLVGAVLGAVVLLVHVALEPQRGRTVPEQLDIVLRAALPAGIAAASITSLRTLDVGPVLLLLALVSAYEVGDFLVGTGSRNAVEGPVAGLVAVAVVGFVCRLVAPAPFTTTSVVLFTALTGVCCPLGQILAAALLPRGSAWAPALRRLDSYLLAAPLWMLLLAGVHGSSTL